MTRALLLGGTTEASLMARALAEAGIEAVFSYAGRTGAPRAQPLLTRVGGFGGVAGLVAYLRAEGISHVIDATHPFAAGMSRNAIAACAETGVPLIALERAPWAAGEGDDWTHVPDIPAAAAALPVEAERVFLAIGRMHLADFAGQPQHHYLLRLVDAPEGPLPLPQAEAVIASGPFTLEEDLALLRGHRIQRIVAKNAGGVGARAKLDAARALGLPVLLIDRPALPARATAETGDAVLHWLAHTTPPALRGV
ncbi:cobalt-precorrin-6A reductase [Phaeovulum sp. W22_SRMD_FR3]|uniref:cobalt-precorrin-6A reductase n=1 Tax=Phaeovulum sp. W22_SRMD_FR3 TaxID=3240274 RepID=UPI003F9C055B